MARQQLGWTSTEASDINLLYIWIIQQECSPGLIAIGRHMQ